MSCPISNENGEYNGHPIDAAMNETHKKIINDLEIKLREKLTLYIYQGNMKKNLKSHERTIVQKE